MRTLVEVVARAGPGGRTVLPVVRASGQLAVRRTGPSTVHLVATAFGPLGGDDAEIRLVVEVGARLAVRTVAAAVVLPARGESPPSVQRVRAEVGGTLDLRAEPTVVTRGAHHRALLHAQLDDGAQLTATEQVQLGRVGEEPGRWTGTTRVERGGVPLLHTTVGLGPGAAAWLPPVAPCAYASTVHLGQDAALGRATAQDAVRLPLDRGWVATAWGDRLAGTVGRLALLEGAAPAEEARR
ncbi:urease accessory protein UreD [Klenkia sp. PcliD-1-E]|uniref:urease accessory protein UreD n=1 Tax=Klenkia sp. PcliD-1-E TaxID=2954492 RepID=UPI0020973DCC|nr:urease accessory protein UreD [Klenkia sp. PcliD-1-E]MCO7222390.1 urease accessory protein UreD [Klenkia sp. PcliD-1-E]